jgi:hypothetical protein
VASAASSHCRDAWKDSAIVSGSNSSTSQPLVWGVASACTTDRPPTVLQHVATDRSYRTRVAFVSYGAVSRLAIARPGVHPECFSPAGGCLFSLQERVRSSELRTGSRERGRCVRTLPWCAAPPAGKALGRAGQATTIWPEDPLIYYMQNLSKLSSRPMQDEIVRPTTQGFAKPLQTVLPSQEANKIDANNLLSRWDAYSNPRFNSRRLRKNYRDANDYVTRRKKFRASPG